MNEFSRRLYVHYVSVAFWMVALKPLIFHADVCFHSEHGRRYARNCEPRSLVLSYGRYRLKMTSSRRRLNKITFRKLENTPPCFCQWSDVARKGRGWGSPPWENAFLPSFKVDKIISPTFSVTNISGIDDAGGGWGMKQTQGPSRAAYRWVEGWGRHPLLGTRIAP